MQESVHCIGRSFVSSIFYCALILTFCNLSHCYNFSLLFEHCTGLCFYLNSITDHLFSSPVHWSPQSHNSLASSTHSMFIVSGTNGDQLSKGAYNASPPGCFSAGTGEARELFLNAQTHTPNEESVATYSDTMALCVRVATHAPTPVPK